jgi:hypothetical protein
MNLWKKNLIDCLTSKGKQRDLINYTTHINTKLIAILNTFKSEIECFDGFVVELRRTRFNENILFPLQASTFVIRYQDDDMVEYQFQWVQGEDDGVKLAAIVNNIAHQRFDQQLKADMGTEPLWLKECVFCTPYEKVISEADDLNEEQIGWFVVDVFKKMTEKFLR